MTCPEKWIILEKSKQWCCHKFLTVIAEFRDLTVEFFVSLEHASEVLKDKVDDLKRLLVLELSRQEMEDWVFAWQHVSDFFLKNKLDTDPDTNELK